jgi:hypothetical protein
LRQNSGEERCGTSEYLTRCQAALDVVCRQSDKEFKVLLLEIVVEFL